MAKVLFIQNMGLEYFGIEIMSAILKERNHKTDLRILNVDGERETLEFVKEYNPYLIGFYVMSVDYDWTFKLAEKIKKISNAKIIFGGPHATFFSEDVIKNPYVDYLCRGEGEYAILDLVEALSKGKDETKIKNLWIKKNGKIYRNEVRPLIEDLDKLPFFDREIYFSRYKFLRNFPAKRFMTDRGCPYNCSYCFNHKLKELYHNKGKYMRIQSPERAVSEIEYVVNNYGAKLVSFTNDSITWNHPWLFEFLKLYKKRINLPFSVQCRVNELNEEVVKRLKESGCYSALIGVESGSERVRREILNRHMPNEQIVEAARLLKKYKIKIIAAAMFGMPTETLQEAFETIDLNIRIKSDIPVGGIFQPIPGTKSYEFALDNHLFKKGYNIDKTQTQFGDSSLNQKDIDKIVNLQFLFYITVKYPFIYPIVKKMIKYNNLRPLYKLIWIFGYGMKYIRSRKISLIEAVRLGWFLRQITKLVK